jgi:hypothetical protein
MQLGLRLGLGRGIGVSGVPFPILAKVTNRWDAHISARYSDAAHTTLIPAGNQVMGAWKDLVAGAYLVQSTTSLKPTVTRAIQGSRDVVRFDNVDDLLSVASGISAAGGLWFGSRHGVQYAPGPITSALNCPSLYDLGAVFALSSALDSGEKTALQLWATANGFGDEYFLVGSTTDTTFYHSITTGGTAPTWTLIGANGVTYQTSANETTDLDAQGLTTPTTVMLPISVATDTNITQIDCHADAIAGALPALSGLSSLTLVNFHSCRLVGSVSSVSGTANLQTSYLYNNLLTGSVPSLSTWSSLKDLRWYSNKITGYVGGGISATCGTIQLQNNLLIESAVDEILSDLVDAGRTSGDGICVCNLDGTGNATPSAAGLADAATLVARGWTVTTN